MKKKLAVLLTSAVLCAAFCTGCGNADGPTAVLENPKTDALLITPPDDGEKYDDEEKTTQVSENDTDDADKEGGTQKNMTQVSEITEQERTILADGMDWNLVFLILIAAITGATVAIYGTSRKK